MKNQIWIAVIIGALVLVLVTGSALSLRDNPIRSLDRTDLPTLTPTPNDVPSSQGQTAYINTQYHYSLDIPTGYSLSTDISGGDPSESSSLVVHAGESDYDKPALRIQTEPVDLENTYRGRPYQSAGELAQLILTDIQVSQASQGKIRVPIKESLFLGNQAYTFSYTGTGYEGLRASSISYPGTYVVMITRYRDTYYQIIFNESDDFKSILESLQFIPDVSL